MLTLEEVRDLAYLARLELSEEELTRFRQEFERVLGYVARLSKIDTSAVTETDAVETMPSLREDVAFSGDALTHQLIVENFPDRAQEALRVPAVFEKPKG